jgi:hypothetical protein
MGMVLLPILISVAIRSIKLMLGKFSISANREIIVVRQYVLCFVEEQAYAGQSPLKVVSMRSAGEQGQFYIEIVGIGDGQKIAGTSWLVDLVLDRLPRHHVSVPGTQQETRALAEILSKATGRQVVFRVLGAD